MIAALALVLVAAVPGCWQPPVEAPVTRPFVAPVCTWCPGHRGLEYDTAVNDQVRAVAAGRVTFAGTVAGTRYVVVQVPDGRKVTYGSLASSTRRTGDRLAAGEPVGRAGPHLFLGVRQDGRPVDPQPLLCRRRGHARLVPL